MNTLKRKLKISLKFFVYVSIPEFMCTTWMGRVYEVRKGVRFLGTGVVSYLLCALGT